MDAEIVAAKERLIAATEAFNKATVVYQQKLWSIKAKRARDYVSADVSKLVLEAILEDTILNGPEYPAIRAPYEVAALELERAKYEWEAYHIQHEKTMTEYYQHAIERDRQFDEKWENKERKKTVAEIVP